jgi:ribosome-associated protein
VKTKKNELFNWEEDTEALSAVIIGMQEIKAHNIRCLDLRDIKHAVCDWFVICHGDSNTQVEAIARSVEDQVRKRTGQKPWHTEGTENAQWVLIDYVDIVVHVFYREARSFYGIEDLWADAPVDEITDDL